MTDSIRYVGVNDHDVDLFEGQYVVPNGMAYNSYVILDEKVAILDTVDHRKGTEYLENLEAALARIENKTYGVCRVTGKLIPKERLRLVPHATLTVEAKEMLAKSGKN